jgi:hypothetical protein
LFFSVGCYFSIHAKSLDKRLPYAWLSLILWIFIIGLKTFLQAQPHYNMLYTGLLKKTSIITGMYAVWALYDRLSAEKSLSRQVSPSWLQCSFFLYVFHEPLLTIIKKILLFFYGSGNVALVFAYFIVPILTILICVYTALMLKKIIPGVYNFVTGGR